MGEKRIGRAGLIYGADYNPDQWLHDPAILREDIRLMKLAGITAVSLGIFAWSALEPREGEFRFEWLDSVIESLHRAGISTILATPSGARPAWMAKKYPEVLRVTETGERRLFGERHNHCYTSPVYREKTALMNRNLAERYGRHPAVMLWHISNEFGGACWCPLCAGAFRSWLRGRYGSLEALNLAWWNAFWSHTYSDWDEIDPPSPLGEPGVHGLNLDWRRFVTHQTREFMKHEIEAVRTGSPEVPVTTNLMGTYDGLDYFELAEPLDLVSWDSYPGWHGSGPRTNPWCDWDEEGRDWRLASNVAFLHDLTRSLKGAPFLLMESTPSATNWQPVSKLKRPGMNELSSIQAVAHGSDSVQYFQWRKSRGGMEKFHGAVVDHAGHEHTRVFREAARLGEVLARLGDAAGSTVQADAALYFDWENRWALEDAKGPRNISMGYREDCLSHYYRLWNRSIAVDVVDRRADLSRYTLLIAPMLYMVRPETAEKIEAFVRSGGVFVATYWSGIVNETDLCHLGGFPGPLRKVLGIRAEEIDALYPEESRTLTMLPGNGLGFEGTFTLRHLWEGLHLEGAEELARFDTDLFAGMPAVTEHRLGEGRAYYLASRNDEAFLEAFYGAVTAGLGLSRAWPAPLPEGVSASARSGVNGRFVFLMNFTDRDVTLDRPDELSDAEPLAGSLGREKITLRPWGYAVLCRKPRALVQ